MQTTMLDLPYFVEAWSPETWVPMVPTCSCRPNPWKDYKRDMVGTKCFKCKQPIHLQPA